LQLGASGRLTISGTARTLSEASEGVEERLADVWGKVRWLI